MREVAVVRGIFSSDSGADRAARRRLRQAFALSMLIHLLLLSLGHPPQLPKAAPPLRVFIRPARDADITPPAHQPAPAERVLAATAEKGIPRAASMAGAASAASTLLRAPDAVDATVGELNAEGLRQYRLLLGGAMAGRQTYPELARQRGWQGRVALLLQVVHGKPPSVVVEKSSTYPLLDSQAQDMLRQAAALTPLPESLAKRDFALPMTLVFELEEP